MAGSHATIVQFSTEWCAPCRVAGSLLATNANRSSPLQSPTTLILDSLGNVRVRIGGAPRATSIRA